MREFQMTVDELLGNPNIRTDRATKRLYPVLPQQNAGQQQ